MTEQIAEADNSAEQVLADAEALLKGGKEEEVENKEVVENAEGAEKTNPDEEEETELVPHGEKSRLGRKLARQEKEIGGLKDTLSEVNERLKKLSETGIKLAAPVDEDVEPELSDYPSREEIQAHSRWTMRQVQKQIPVPKQADEWKVKYEQEYAKLLKETVDPDEDGELFTLLTDSKDLTYNMIHTKDPHVDFAKNLRNATKAITAKLKTPKPNVQGKKPAGVAIPNSAPAEKTMDRSKFLKGLSADERAIADALSDDEFKSVFG